MKIITTKTPETDTAKQLVLEMNKYLKSSKVLLLLAGGSAVKIYVDLHHYLTDDDYSNLTICMGDERWNENPDHTDSNFKAIKDLQVIKDLEAKGAKIETILHGKTIEDDTADFNTMLDAHFTAKHKVISLQGIGPDGHTAGILPAPKDKFNAVFSQDAWAVYHTDIDTKFPKRITISPKTINAVDTIIVYSAGESKLSPLSKLNTIKNLKQTQIHDMPSKILCGKDVNIYTDIKI
jgi:6-phosphogluconolactonase/glucosamine-6-phosphate isomerase/deaminase